MCFSVWQLEEKCRYMTKTEGIMQWGKKWFPEIKSKIQKHIWISPFMSSYKSLICKREINYP